MAEFVARTHGKGCLSTTSSQADPRQEACGCGCLLHQNLHGIRIRTHARSHVRIAPACQPCRKPVVDSHTEVGLLNLSPNQPVVKPVVAEVHFLIVGGAFGVPANAEKLAQSMKAEGFETSLHFQSHNQLTIVAMGGYATEEAARPEERAQGPPKRG